MWVVYCCANIHFLKTQTNENTSRHHQPSTNQPTNVSLKKYEKCTKESDARTMGLSSQWRNATLILQILARNVDYASGVEQIIISSHVLLVVVYRMACSVFIFWKFCKVSSGWMHTKKATTSAPGTYKKLLKSRHWVRERRKTFEQNMLVNHSSHFHFSGMHGSVFPFSVTGTAPDWWRQSACTHTAYYNNCSNIFYYDKVILGSHPASSGGFHCYFGTWPK